MRAMSKPRIVKGDIDGFFGLFVDNLLQLLLIITLCPVVCGFSPEFVATRVLPGAALSILFGNLFYAWQAWRLAERTGRDDVTAIPYGINTVSLVAYLFLIMGPVYRETGSADLAWKAGLFACLLSAIMEICGAFAGDMLRRNTPRAALLSTLAGIAITFIAMGFVFQIFAAPAIAIVPMMLILLAYAGRLRLPLSLPAGFVAVVLGVGIAWLLRAFGLRYFEPASGSAFFGLTLPHPAVADLVQYLSEPTGWK
jgi:AGZA family xanthine/uracil permease-like MFS transporter